jgi:hypothetical protein
VAVQVDPLIAMGRQPHYPPLAERFAAVPPLPENPTPVEAMAHRLTTTEGKKLYALRKQIPEPVFGIIKSAFGFRQFLLRGLDKVRGEWSLVTMAYNMKRLFALAGAAGGPKGVVTADIEAVAAQFGPTPHNRRRQTAHNAEATV